MIQGRTVWQQACGDTNRNYSEICIKWGVILNGPGYTRYPDCLKVLKNDGWASRKITDIKRFAVEMREGDFVVLRLGTNKILAVGLIVGEYEWHECFSDVDGWDLQHVRRVNWIWSNINAPKFFKTYALKQGDTTQVINSSIVNSWLISLNINSQQKNHNLPSLPSAGRMTNEGEIAEYLYEHGVSNNFIESLLREFGELKRIAKWYVTKSPPSEFETVAYLVIPLLRSLGWTPQKMAIEWKNLDLALFNKLPRENDNLSAVVEAKKKDRSCLMAFSQAESYTVGRTSCERLIVTDGLRYGIFLKEDNRYNLYAYFNLLQLRESYPIYGDCKGVKEGLTVITADWRR